jgi:hypothetical protein
MTPRSIRRAAERKQRKLEKKMQRALAPETAPALLQPQVSEAYLEEAAVLSAPKTQKRAIANRANAQLSTGPTSPEGKASSSLNAVKTGLTGRTVLLASDDAAAYQHHIEAYEQELAPVGPQERDLVQSIADTVWRLRRIPGLEMAIYAQGRVEFADQFEHEAPEVRPILIEMHTHLEYEKPLRNLHIQEARLNRRREKELAELRALQQQRKAKEAEAAAQLHAAPKPSARAAHAQNGFEFSNPKRVPDFLTVEPSDLTAALDLRALTEDAA